MTDRKKRIEQADAVWRWIVKERGAGRCQYNGCSNRGEEAHHIFVLWLEMGFIYDRLQELSKQVVHYKNPDLLEIYEGLKSGKNKVD